MADAVLFSADGHVLFQNAVGGGVFFDDHCCCCALDLTLCPGTYTVDLPDGYARWVSPGTGATTLVLTYDPIERQWSVSDTYYSGHTWTLACFEYADGTLDRDGNPLPKGRGWRLRASDGNTINDATWVRFEDPDCPPTGVFQVFPYPPTDGGGNFVNYALEDATVS